ncbi:hypothetical protein GUITHDRAFT_139605 [Guillardia theta CCMP2712]|uniref:PDZ domain-containing protein n=1 Tax=Guillardia theta (strain CCMP2712) TaxID=905079 RepID=L1J817_GUITC|nr:hypothetical protein GUITHDRAFT_139605 [Guillardia theta CCMP2712]EKX44678.1 hypothetical protein GUITHDRAFT_139605 [Guillardia theta CCMP2712]|eukprot:XP_005831658.1 hypothetical protein GUITHDRAFT_139605 [Guillardia theta CCMP2712]
MAETGKTAKEKQEYKRSLLENLSEEAEDIGDFALKPYLMSILILVPLVAINAKINKTLRDLRNPPVYDLSGKEGGEKNLSNAGVGLLLSAPEKSGSHGTHVIVDMLVPGGAAEKQFAGVIRPDDLITAVRDDSKETEFTCTTGLSVQQVKDLIVGAPGSTISLRLRSQESGEVYECRGLIRGLEKFRRGAEQDEREREQERAEERVEETAVEEQAEGAPRSRIRLQAKMPSVAPPVQQVEFLPQVKPQSLAASRGEEKEKPSKNSGGTPAGRSCVDVLLMLLVLVGLVAAVLVQLQGQGTLAAHERMLREEMEAQFHEKEKKFNCTPLVHAEQRNLDSNMPRCQTKIDQTLKENQKEFATREKQLLASAEATSAKKSSTKAKEIFRRVVHEFVEYHDRWDEMPLKSKKNSLEDEFRSGIMKLLKRTRDMVH